LEVDKVELLMWIVIGIIAGLGALASIPLLVVGTCWVVINVLLRLADGAIWLLDEGWMKIRPRRQPAPSLLLGDVTLGKQPVPVLTVPLAITSNG
jgi:hypothetical protein